MKNGLFTKNTSLFFRGIAILMVIFSHYFEWGAAFVENEKAAHFIASLGDWGVGIFFLLSGYALYKGYGGKKTDGKYVVKRLINVYIPYLIIATTIMLLSGALHDLEGLIRLLTGADYWFMVILFLIYIAFYFVGKLPSRYRVFIMTVFIIDLSLFLFVKGFREFWYTANWAFALGLIIGKHEMKIPPARNGSSIDIKDFLFCTLGRVSLYIYVLHSFIYFRVVNAPFVIDSGMNWYLQLLIALVLTVLIAVIIEKIYTGIVSLISRKKK
ncbi:MAG: acyltransferase [Lachnospiraceae bacterium]|nr:acyltransferase [Lachnospiraceae bacterium]